MAYSDAGVGKQCSFCGQGTLIKNPKTGKIFCDQKCWLKNQPQAQLRQQPPNQFVQNLQQQKEDERIKGFVKEKNEKISWLNAKRCAAQIVSHRNLAQPAEILKEFEFFTKSIYDIKNNET